MNSTDVKKPLERFLVIHGHFYQPPRENPWTEAIERQEGAAPYHDWNERISTECYGPNSMSRILNGYGRIAVIVDNYHYISFNFGPTLMSWLETKQPDIYHRILEADFTSQKLHSGNGDAIAQAYNHMILPLANARDKRTQILWGLADFRHRFGREAKAIWLPETAANYPTLSALVEHGMKFLILAPSQALRAKPLETKEEWQDVSNGSIDVTVPYRCFLKDSNGKKLTDRFIDIFFYHGPLSRQVSFEHLLRNAGTFADAIEKAFIPNRKEPQLIAIATDGESYGHHEPFGDMALAYLLNVEAPERGLEVTNCTEYLAKHPPTHEVEINDGPNGEGTAWSCSHGVGRWYRDCGCSTGGPAGWNQQWRWHLRGALDRLRDDLASLYEEHGGRYFKNPWQARDAYIQVILDRSKARAEHFFAEQASRKLGKDERVQALKLLEMQRHAMLMYTSCGWFFADISGIETVQILRYAARAIQLAQSFGDDNLEARLLAELKNAKSNLPRFQDGKVIYEKLVKPSVVDFPQIVNHYVIVRAVQEDKAPEKIFHYWVSPVESSRMKKNDAQLLVGQAKVGSGITLEEKAYLYCLLCTSGRVFHTLVREANDDVNYAQLKASVESLFSQDLEEFLEKARKTFGGEHFTLQDMLYDERLEVTNLLLQDKLDELSSIYSGIYEKHAELIETLHDLGIPIPVQLRAAAEQALSFKLQNEVEKLSEVTEVYRYEGALEIARTAERLGLALNTEETQAFFQRMIEERMNTLCRSMRSKNCHQLLQLWEIITRLGIKVREDRIQNQLYKVLTTKVPKLIDEIVAAGKIDARYVFVSSILRLAYRLNFNIESYKDRLKLVEEKLSQDPQFWP